MKNYNKFLGIKIIVFALLSFTASAHSIKINEECDTCIEKKSKENNAIKQKVTTTSNYSGLSLFELANMYEVNLGGEPAKDLSPEVKEKENSSTVMSLREMIALCGVKVL